jgi:hypothetical protein
MIWHCISHSMATSNKRKRGRPPSGKKGYCIRVTPETHDELTRAAEVAGYKSLGDWLDAKALTAGPPQKSRQDSRRISSANACSVFVRQSAQAKEALAEMRDVIDCEHEQIGTNAKAANALRSVRNEYRRLLALLCNVGLDEATKPRTSTTR